MIINVIIFILIFFNTCLYMLLEYLCVFSSGVYLYFRILMYVNRHEQFEIGCGAILNKILLLLLLLARLPPHARVCVRVPAVETLAFVH